MPTITLTGSGFGSEPSPQPASHPEGQQGCPSAPGAGDGYLYGTSLYFSDLNATHGDYKNWNAGQSTAGNNGQFDCIGLVISSWTPTKVVFGFGNLYGKLLPKNTYFMSKGDSFTVHLRGASATRSAYLTGVPDAPPPT